MTQPKICIKGSADPTEAKRIIEFLTRLGGVNDHGITGKDDELFYWILDNGVIDCGDPRPIDHTLITLQPDVLLPKNYYCELSNGKKKVGTHDRENIHVVTLTESQFLALTAPSTKEEREIEGYVCPMDLINFNVKKGEVIKTKDCVGDYETNRDGNKLPAEIVETWEPKYKEVRKAVFISEDGVPIYEGDDYWPVPEDFTTRKFKAQKLDGQIICKMFSTKQAAENYIVENKPCLNWDEAMDWFEENKRMSAQTAGDALKKIIQSKIKG